MTRRQLASRVNVRRAQTCAAEARPTCAELRRSWPALVPEKLLLEAVAQLEQRGFVARARNQLHAHGHAVAVNADGE